MKEFALSIDGEPMGYKRVVRGRGGMAFNPPEVRDHKEKIARCFQNAYPGHSAEPPTGLVSVLLVFDEGVRSPQHQGDLDNYVKLALDALNKIAWKDDRQIIHISAHLTRGVEVRVYDEGTVGPYTNIQFKLFETEEL